MKFSTIKHVFFDLDHTLWDFDRNSKQAFEIILNPLFPQLDIEVFVSVYNPINQACWKLYQVDKLTHEELRYNRLKDSFEVLQIPITDAQIYQLSDAYIAHLPTSNHLMDGCVEALEYLHQKYSLHIITNGFAEVQFKKLHRSGIAHFFDTVTHSEMAGVKKPHPAIYEMALKQAGAGKEESIMIGDCLQADVQGAMDFGIEALFFNPENMAVASEIKQINNLVTLKNIL